MRQNGVNRGLFAIASASLAILGLIYGSDSLIGQSAPAWMHSRETWVYGWALLVLVASAGLCISFAALPSALAIVGLLAIWALTCTPPIFSAPFSIGAWYGCVEALTSLAGAWILYAMLREQSKPSGLPIAGEGTVRAAQIIFGVTCVFYGWSHFAFADYTASMVPNWLPLHLPFAYFTGLGHIAAGVGIVIGILPRLAATLEAIMMSLFGLLVWVPSFFTVPRPEWATPPPNQWSEIVVNLILAAAAWIVAASLSGRSWAFNARPRADKVGWGR
jgi:uncharacterized membrane protein YphA (DoxX/SURF4 family)